MGWTRRQRALLIVFANAVPLIAAAGALAGPRAEDGAPRAAAAASAPLLCVLARHER